MWVSHLCGSGPYVGFVPGGVGTQQACFVGRLPRRGMWGRRRREHPSLPAAAARRRRCVGGGGGSITIGGGGGRRRVQA